MRTLPISVVILIVSTTFSSTAFAQTTKMVCWSNDAWITTEIFQGNRSKAKEYGIEFSKNINSPAGCIPERSDQGDAHVEGMHKFFIGSGYKVSNWLPTGIVGKAVPTDTSMWMWCYATQNIYKPAYFSTAFPVSGFKAGDFSPDAMERLRKIQRDFTIYLENDRGITLGTSCKPIVGQRNATESLETEKRSWKQSVDTGWRWSGQHTPLREVKGALQ